MRINGRTRYKATLIAAGCAAIGVVAGIAGAAAAPSGQRAAASPSAPAAAEHGPEAGGRGGPVVHADLVVLDKAGTGFITATEDNGTVQSLSGEQLTIGEAVGNVTYKTVTVTIPAGATVIRNFQKASLSAVKIGDRVRVTQSRDGTTLFATDGTHQPSPRPEAAGERGADGLGAPGPAGPPPVAG